MLTPYRIPPRTPWHVDLDVSVVSPVAMHPQHTATHGNTLQHAERCKETLDFSPQRQATKNHDVNDATHLEQIARQIFNVNHSGKKSPKPPRLAARAHAAQPSSPANTLRNSLSRAPPLPLPTSSNSHVYPATTLSFIGTTSSPKTSHSDSAGETSTGYGLELEVVAGRNLPKRLAHGHDPVPYVCVSLVLLNMVEEDLIVKGETLISHDVRRRSNGSNSCNISRSTDRHVRLAPQCQTHTLAATCSPEWNAPLHLGQAVRVNNALIQGSQPLHSAFAPKKNEIFVVLVSVCDSFAFGSDRVLGSCFFPILPGQRMEKTLALRAADSLPDPSARAATIRVRAFLNVASASSSSSSPPNQNTHAHTSSWQYPVSAPSHRETSPSLTPTQMREALTPSRMRRIPQSPPGSSHPHARDRSVRDLSDSDSSHGDCLDPHQDLDLDVLEMCTPAADVTLLSPATSGPSSSHSTASRAAVWEANVTSAHKLPGPAQPLSGPKSSNGVSNGATPQSPSRRLGRPVSPALDRDIVVPTKTYSPTYSELEMAFMARVAARKSSTSSEQTLTFADDKSNHLGAPPPAPMMAPLPPARRHTVYGAPAAAAYEIQWKPTAHS